MTKTPASITDKVLLPLNTDVTCPQCTFHFPLDRGFAAKALEELALASAKAAQTAETELSARIEARLKGQYAARSQEDAETIKRQAGEIDGLKAREKALADREKNLDATVEERAAKRAEALKSEREEKLTGQISDLVQKLAQANSRANSLADQNSELQIAKAEWENTARELREKAVNEAVSAAVQRVRGEQSLKEQDHENTVRRLKDQVNELQQRLEQGSQQAQGETLELALEVEITKWFPHDQVAEVPKGMRGADVVHHVRLPSEVVAGTIVWETKRTQNWSKDWPGKLKADQQSVSADLAVLVTTALPKDFPEGHHFGVHEDVWVCTPQYAVQLAMVLRSGVIAAYRQKVVSVNKGAKAEEVYDYVMSAQFISKLQALMSIHERMRKDLDREKTRTIAAWGKRERQLIQGSQEVLSVVGALQAFAGHEVPQLEALTDMDDDDDTDEGDEGAEANVLPAAARPGKSRA